MASLSRNLWSVSRFCGEAEEVRPLIIHGIKVGAAMWRFGAPMPDVSLPGGALVVSGRVKEMLGWCNAEFVQATHLVVSHPDVDWRGWDGRWLVECREIRRRKRLNEWEDLVIPYVRLGGDYLGTGKSELLDSKVLRGRRLDTLPDMWWVRTATVPKRADRGGAPEAAVSNVEWGSGVHQIPWAFPGHLLFEVEVRRILEQFAEPDSLDFAPVTVVD